MKHETEATTKDKKTPFSINLGRRIQERRELLGLNQKQLGEMIGVGASAVAQYESGARSPNNELLVNTAKALGVTTDYLMGAHTTEGIFMDEKIREAFEGFSALAPRDRQVVCELIKVLTQVKNPHP